MTPEQLKRGKEIEKHLAELEQKEALILESNRVCVDSANKAGFILSVEPKNIEALTPFEKELCIMALNFRHDIIDKLKGKREQLQQEFTNL